jgi:nucleoside-diphosphate-sugar epimerase
MEHASDSINFNQPILITGGDGFVGAQVVQYLRDVGYVNITAFMRDDLDLADMDAVAAKVLAVRPDIIIDCAGITPHQDVRADAYNQNIQFTNNIINAIHESGRDIGLIYMSSVSVYGPPVRDSGVVFEDDELNPQNPYAQSKAVCERLIQKQVNIASVILRIANIVGKDAFINHVLNKGAASLRGDVPFERDIVHARNIAKMVEKSIGHIQDNKPSTVVNCGSGNGYAFTAIIAEIEKQTGKNIVVSRTPSLDNDIIRLICDRQRAMDILDWRPTVTTLDEIIKGAVEYHEQ